MNENRGWLLSVQDAGTGFLVNLTFLRMYKCYRGARPIASRLRDRFAVFLGFGAKPPAERAWDFILAATSA